MTRFHPTTLIFSGFFLLGLLSISWGVLLPDLTTNLHMSPAQSGMFFLVMSLGTVSGAFLGGKYVQKFNFLKLFASLALIETLLLLAISWVNSVVQLFVGIFFFGLFCSIMFTIGHTLIARLHANQRAKMMGLMDFMFSLGTLAAPFFVVVLYWWQEDWRWPLRLLALALIGLALYALLIANAVHANANEASAPRQSLSYRVVLRKPVFVALALAMLGYGAVEWGNGNWFVSYANSALGYNTEQARLVFAWFTAGMVVSRLGFAWLLPYFGARYLLRVLAALMLVGTFVLKMAVEPTFLSFGNALLGLGLGGLFPLLLATAMDLEPENGPVLSGLSNIGGSMGCQIAGLGTGLWANSAGVGTAFWLIPFSACWLFAMVWLFSRRATIRQPDIQST